MAVVDPQPHATSLSNVLRSERSWNLLTYKNFTKLTSFNGLTWWCCWCCWTLGPSCQRLWEARTGCQPQHSGFVHLSPAGCCTMGSRLLKMVPLGCSLRRGKRGRQSLLEVPEVQRRGGSRRAARSRRGNTSVGGLVLEKACEQGTSVKHFIIMVVEIGIFL